MFPLINLFGRELSTYGIVSLIGILISGLFVCKTAKKRGHDDNDFIVFFADMFNRSICGRPYYLWCDKC